MSSATKECEHIRNSVGLFASVRKILRSVENNNDKFKCGDCDSDREDLLRLCLYPECFALLCTENYFGNDHSAIHYEADPRHSVQLNIATKRIWCHACRREVRSSLSGRRSNASRSSSENVPDRIVSDGLVGLVNLGHTCYMNAAIQCLSNTPTLTEYFIRCHAAVTRSSHKPNCLSKSYLSLMRDVWVKKRPSGYVAPTGVVRSVKSAHPLFQGYLQQDSQEFLRCFMDSLHEELMEPRYCDDEIEEEKDTEGEEDEDMDSEPSEAENPSEPGEYETADSGLSEDSNPPDESENRGKSDEDVYNDAVSQSTKTAFSPLVISSSNLSRRVETKKRKKVYQSIISHIFDGKLISTVKCLTCNRISTTEETFQDLSLPIPNQEALGMSNQLQQQPQQAGWFSWFWNFFMGWFYGPKVSLNDCLSYFFSADELKGDNMYSCGKCKKLRNGLKYSKVTVLPDTLCIHLKRFRHEFTFSSKISSKVTFPLVDLDMSQWLHEDCESSESTYDLTGVICHQGTAAGGHYIAYCLNHLDQEWYEFDDTMVSRVDPSSIVSLEAYVLFYRKINDKMYSLRDQIHTLSLRALGENASLMTFYVSKEWFNKFENFAEPGPIDNSSFLCVHGGVLPHKFDIIRELTVSLPQIVWEKLHKSFGGGPPCTRLYECSQCKAEQESIARQKNYELTEFKRLYSEFQERTTTDFVYCLSSSWYRKWEDYVRGRHPEPPGPITNKTILTTRNGALVFAPMSDHLTVSQDIWNFLLSTYGGGPEVVTSIGGGTAIINASSSLYSKQPVRQRTSSEIVETH